MCNIEVLGRHGNEGMHNDNVFSRFMNENNRVNIVEGNIITIIQ